MLMRPELVQGAWDYFRNVQTKDQKYIPFITDTDQPAINESQRPRASGRSFSHMPLRA